eukprot:6849135-Alexandrium_andersonii.AAC.1
MVQFCGSWPRQGAVTSACGSDWRCVFTHVGPRLNRCAPAKSIGRCITVEGSWDELRKELEPTLSRNEAWCA